MARPWKVRVRVGLLLVVPLAAACNRAPAPGLARGKALFDNCLPCHGVRGDGNQVLGAPAIAGLPRWYVEAQLESFQQAHRGGAPFDTSGIRMKSMAWTLDLKGDVPSVAEYVASLAPARPAPVLRGDVAAGQASFQVCTACHGADARGNQDMHAPPLLVQSDWYLVTQLRKFKAGWRGTHPQDMWGMTMRPNAMMLDDAGMTNVVAYIQTLRP